jgi:nucleoside-diphosphate-sugar epimerase
MWFDALAAHEAGRVRATEVRASDFVGTGAKTMFSEVVLPAVREGRAAWVPADLSVPHSYTYLGDVSSLLVTVATDERGWGRPWHVPSPPPVSVRELAAEAARALGAPAPRLRHVPYPVLWTAGVLTPTLREFREVHYQFAEPFVIDATDATRTFGLAATALQDAVAEMVARPDASVTPGTR